MSTQASISEPPDSSQDVYPHFMNGYESGLLASRRAMLLTLTCKYTRCSCNSRVAGGPQNLHAQAHQRDTHDLGFVIQPWAQPTWELDRDI
jgi:hypothetical protein